MNYKNLNDYELVYQVKENDENAYKIILEKYSSLLCSIAKQYYRKNKNLGLEYEDFYQEGMIGLLRALDDYDSSNSLFYTYALLCMKRQIETCIRTSQRLKHACLNNAVSLNESIKEDSNLLVEDVIASSYNLEEEYMYSDLYNKIMECKYDFSLEESLILELRLNSFTVNEIATLLDLSRKRVDYRLHKIRKRLSVFA